MRAVTRLGRYELIDELGAGGMGTVFVACERSAKVIRRRDDGGPSRVDLVGLMTNEASIVARLAHENVVRIHRLGEQDGQYFIAMELDAFEQPTLRAVLMDVRQAKMVIGGRTLEAIERMFFGAEQKGIAIVALISNDPIQKLDFTDVVGRAAPRHGRVSVAIDEALRLVGLRA